METKVTNNFEEEKKHKKKLVRNVLTIVALIGVLLLILFFAVLNSSTDGDYIDSEPEVRQVQQPSTSDINSNMTAEERMAEQIISFFPIMVIMVAGLMIIPMMLRMFTRGRLL